MKKYISLLLVLVISMILCVTAFAATPSSDDMVAPCQELAVTSKCTLSISGTTATCNSVMYGYSNITKIKVVQTLQKQGLLWTWSSVSGASWTKTVSSTSATVTNKKTGLASGTYRLKTVFTLTASDGTTETITVYSDEREI